MKNVYVVAHAESIHHVEGKVGGWFDTALTDRGRVQAQLVAEKLVQLLGSDIPMVTSSDLLRAKETAEIIGNELKCPVNVTSDLRELSAGIAEGKPQDWLDDHFSPAPNNNRLDHRSIENAETKREFLTRVYRAMDQILKSEHPNHVIVTHGYAMTFVIGCWIRMPIDAAGYVNFRSNSGGITHLHEDDFLHNRAVIFLSDTSHLANS
jgi:probable phosphoglycerate mutase